MNPNDVLAALNLLIAVGWVSWAGLFAWAFYTERPPNRSARLFLLVFVAISLAAATDIGTTGTLRVIDNVAFPGIPHALLPDFNMFPAGISLLIVIRILKAIFVWGGLFLVITARSKEAERG